MKVALTMKRNLRVVVLLFFLLHISTYSIEATSNQVPLHSEAAIVMDASSGKVLFEEKMNQTMYPASITKIVTAIVAIEEGALDEIVTVSGEATEVIGTRVYLLEDEQVSLLKLVQGLLINSGNDAGTAIAEHMAGSEEAFARKMNQFVQEKVGVTDTNFTNPHGLFDKDHVTTAYDMAKITQYAMKNEAFRDIVGTKELEWNGEGWETTLYNHNRLLWRYEGATGVKNGYVQKSGHTLVTTATRDEMELIAVTLKAPSAEFAYEDMESLFNYGFTHFQPNVLFSNKMFSAENGERFELPEDLFFVSRQDEAIELEVSESGLLTITGEENRVITSVLLEPIQIPSKKLVEEKESEPGQQNDLELDTQPLFMRWLIQVWSLLQLK